MLGFIYRIDLVTLAVVLVATMLMAKEVGYQIGRRVTRAAPANDDVKSGVAFTITGMLGLMAFTFALTISMAQGRFDQRRALVVAEANAIGTVYLRAQTIGGDEGAAIARLLPDYTRLRIQDLNDPETETEIAAIYARMSELQHEMWSAASQVGRRDSGPVTALLIQALNDMSDQSLAVRNAYESRVPIGIVRLLIAGSFLVLGCIGYFFGLAGRRHAVVSSMLILMWVVCLALIIDLDKPRRGFIQIEPTPLLWTLQGFAPTR
jgi:hypothetical protein